MKNLPFVCSPKHKVVPVGDAEIGTLYLLSKGGITPNENPVNFQEQQRKQQRFLLKLNKRIQALAKDANVPVSVMRKKVMEADTTQKAASVDKLEGFHLLRMAPRTDTDIPTEGEKLVIVAITQGVSRVRIFDRTGLMVVDRISVELPPDVRDDLEDCFSTLLAPGFGTEPVTEKTKKKVFAKLIEHLDIPVTVEAEVDDSGGQGIFDYLDEETADLLFGLQEDKRAIAIRAATFMLSKRVAYPVKLKANALAGSQSLVIETPQSPIGEGSHVKFGSSYVEVSKSLIPTPTEDGSSVLGVRETLISLKDGDVGYLCAAESTSLKIGYPEWSETDTKDYLSEELISALYDFYLTESGAVPETDEPVEKPQLKSSPSSTGAKSTTDSSGSELETPVSTTKTLETSLAG